MILNLSRIKRVFRDNWPSTAAERWTMVKENFQILLKTAGILTWLVIFVLFLMEVKRYYNIDVFPGYNSNFEEVYGSVRGGITKDAKGLK